MSQAKPFHLTQDQLMVAITDPEQLSSDAKAHLTICGKCQEEKNKLSQRLGNISHLSSRIQCRIAPWYKAKNEDEEFSTPRPFGLKFMLIIAAVISVIFLLNFYDPFHIKSQQDELTPGQYLVDQNRASLSLDILPEIYSGLVGFSDDLLPWWQKKDYIETLSLTSDEIGKLDNAWKEALSGYKKLKNEVHNRQVDLAISLEKDQWDKKTVDFQYQQLLQKFALLTNVRFKMLQMVRNILGYQRFQRLLQLQTG